MNNLLKAVAFLPLQLVCLVILGCTQSPSPASDPAHDEPEAIARTEFTDRIENFFEYEPLQAGTPSQFRIHLTDLTDGTPVDQAQVTLTVNRPTGAGRVTETVAKVGKVTGIYVAEITIPQPGLYDIEFHVKNARLEERLPLADFRVE